MALLIPQPVWTDTDDLDDAEYDYRLQGDLRGLVIGLADETHGEILAQIVRETLGNARSLCSDAIDAMVRVDARCPITTLPLLIEQSGWFFSRHYVARLLSRFDPSAAWPLVKQMLEAQDAQYRGEILGYFLWDPEAISAEWITWLCDRWYGGDRVAERRDARLWLPSGYVNLDAWIACRTPHLEPSQGVLAASRLAASDTFHRYQHGYDLQPCDPAAPLELWPNESDLTDAVLADPAVFAGRIDTLDLPLETLLALREPETLLDEILDGLRRRNPKEERDLELLDQRAFELLRRWPDGSHCAAISALFLCPEASCFLRRELKEIVWAATWTYDPVGSRAFIRSAMAEGVGTRSFGDALLHMAQAPEPADADFFRWASTRTKPEFRFEAIRAMARLGVSDREWRTCLTECLADDDACVRAAASGALLALGDEGQLETLVRIATHSEDDYARAAAIRTLGEHDRQRFMAVFVDVLFNAVDRETFEIPIREASWQLAVDGAPEGLTLLLRACLNEPPLEEVATGYMEITLFSAAWLEPGQSLPEPDRASWRYHKPWEWRCC